MEEALSKDDVRSMSEDARARLLDKLDSSTEGIKPATKSHVFVLSANDRESLSKTTALIAEYVNERPVYLFPDLLKSLAFTLGQRRTLLPWKVATHAADHDDLIETLKDVTLAPTWSVKQPRIGFVFTGQGAQWPEMGIQLYHAYPIYALAIQKADQILRRLGASWSLIAELENSKKNSQIDLPSISQPACTALQMALVDLLQSWGVNAHSVVGHSSGEIAAAYAARILDMESCMSIAFYRGLVAMTLVEKPGVVKGGMLAVGASQEDTQAMIDTKTDVVGDCAIACINSPKSITISGDAARISQLAQLADARSIWNRRLNVEVAYHSHHMIAVADQYALMLGEVKPSRDVRVNFHSSLRGHEVEFETLDTSYWVDNLTSPVKFFEAFTSLCEPKEDKQRGVDLVIEIGPHSALQGPIRQIVQTFEGNHGQLQSFSSIVRNTNSVTSLLDLSARLVTSGCNLNLAKVNFPNSESTPKYLSDLPPYQWDHSKRYWHEVRERREMLKYMSPRHDLLGSRNSNCAPEAPMWKNVLTVDDVPWLRDHSIQDVIIFPMAGYLCMAMEACQQQARWNGRAFDRISLQHVTVHQALTMSGSTAVELQLSLAPWNEGSYSLSDTWCLFKVSSWTSERGWLHHCQGLVAALVSDQQNPVANRDGSQVGLEHQMGDLSELRSCCQKSLDADELYRNCENVGFHYGPTFRRMQDVQVGPSYQARYNISIPETLVCMPYNCQSDYFIHPISLDVVFQGTTVFLSEDPTAAGVPYMPVSILEITVAAGMVQDPGSIFQVHATSTPPDALSRKGSYNYVVCDMQRSSCPVGIVAKGVIEAPVQGIEISQEGSESRCLKTQWEPSMSFLNQDKMEAIFSLPPPKPYNPQGTRKLEELGLDYIKQALGQVHVDEIPATYLRKLHAWMVSKTHEANGVLIHDKMQGLNGHVLKSKMPVGNVAGILDDTRREINGDATKGRRKINHNSSEAKFQNGPLVNGSAIDEGICVREEHIENQNGDLHYEVTSRSDADSAQLALLLMRRVGTQLPAILRDQIDPAVLMWEDERFKQFEADFVGRSRLYAAVTTYIQKLAFQNPVLRILDLGARDTFMTAQVLEGIAPILQTSSGSVQYEIADGSADFTAKLGPWLNFVKQKRFGPNLSPLNSTSEKDSYDVIILVDGANTRRPKELANIQRLLKTGGKVIVFRNLYDRDSASLLPLITLPGWWAEDSIDCNGVVNGKTASSTLMVVVLI